MNLAILLAGTLSASSGADAAEPDRYTRTVAFEGTAIEIDAPADDKAANAGEPMVFSFPELPLVAERDEEGAITFGHGKHELDEQDDAEEEPK